MGRVCGAEFPLVKTEKGSDVYLDGQCECTEKLSVHVRDVIDEVENGRLHEALFMSFYNIWARAGVDVMGGFNQIEYVTSYKWALEKIFKKIGETKKSKAIHSRTTNLLDLGIFVAFTPQGVAKPGTHILLEGGLTRSQLEIFAALDFSAALDASVEIIESIFGKKPDYSSVLNALAAAGMERLIT